MIPVKLTLRNFMSYGEEPTTLDFAGMHVACLSGDNGNGKSALLDAITYALWGETRASGSQASSEDDLVRLGAEEMEVTFEFLLGEDRYRVIKKRNRRTRTGDWQVHVADPDGTWRSAGGSGMRDTERQLIRILRMEYETFLNSAYIQQGRADEFTRQKPDARKRILADILDLSRYDRLETMAKEHRAECDLALKDLEGEIRHLEARASEEPDLRKQRTEGEEALRTWTAERAAREERRDLLRERLAKLDEKAHRLRDLEERSREVSHEVADMEAQIARLNGKIEQDAALIAQKPAIVADFRRLQELRKRVEQLEPPLNALHGAERALAEAKGRLETARQTLLRELDRAESEWKQAQERARRIADLEKRLADIAPKIEALERAQQEQEEVRAALAKAEQSFAALLARNSQFKNELAEVEDVLEVLAKPRAACPVCQSDLSGGRQERVVLRQQQKKRALQEQLDEVKREGAVCKKERESWQARRDALEAQLRGAAALKGQQIEWERALKENMELNAGAEEIEAREEELRGRMEGEDYGAEERTEIERLEQEIERLQSAAKEYQAAQAEARALTERQVERRHAQLEEAERAQAQDRAEMERLAERREKRQTQIAAAQKQIENLRAQLVDYETARRETAEAERAARDAAAECDAARDRVTRLQHSLADCARAREQLAVKKAERDKVARDKLAYGKLAAAFGKKGVQALIIDNVLPEMQEEANRLLARMTDNGMQITLSTLRAARTGSSQIETLDISVSDDAGTRPYEMFSGGEGFRINFALRIALSRLLARRAGASLQTLILDEGFGTQDVKGRERLVEAIEAIKDEFRLILVISHIEELKDAFPTRIEILKTPDGSRINLME
jgi:exonuclease SbcC